MRAKQSVLFALALLCSATVLLSACGRAGPPKPPGPADQVTYPHMYPSD